MDFALVIKFLIESFGRKNIDFALIGGFALQAAGVVRTTGDVDLLILSEDSAKVKDILLKHGYELIHESEDALNFTGKKIELGRIDFLLAHRKYTLSMLKRAEKRPILEDRFTVKTIKVEDLIGLKVQSSSNEPERKEQDMLDIKQLLKRDDNGLDLGLIREYFDLFGRGEELEAILKEIKNA